MTNVEALKSLYTQLGGSAADVANASTSVEVLNAIAAKYEGDDDAILNPDAIANIAAVADSIGGGGSGDGSGDFNVLTMTIIGDGGNFGMNAVDDGNGYLSMLFDDETDAFFYYLNVKNEEEKAITVLYTGDSAVLSPYNVVKSITGSATFDEETFHIVATGDFTVAGYMDD